MKNYYELLEVNPKASKEIIEKAYKVLIKQCHPDAYIGEEKRFAEEKTVELNEAYHILTNDFLRSQYDLELQRESYNQQSMNQNRTNNRNYFNDNIDKIKEDLSINKDTKIIGKTTIVAATINLIVNLLCIKFIGLWAAAVSTLVAMIINYNLRTKRIRKYIKLVCEYKIILSLLFLVIDLLAFYCNKTAINIINFIIILIYCIYLNQNTIQEIFKEIQKKV